MIYCLGDSNFSFIFSPHPIIELIKKTFVTLASRTIFNLTEHILFAINRVFFKTIRKIKDIESNKMALRATPQFVGVPDFKVIDINPSEVAKCLQDYVNRGSRITGVSIDEISLRVTAGIADDSKATLVDLLEHGMKLFDALTWLTAGRPTTHALQIDPTMTKDMIPPLQEIAKSVFYVYFFLLTQARYPVRQNDANPPKVPNFLSVVMGLNQPQHHYIEQICSFNPVAFDAKWAEHVSFRGLGQEALSRFGLGVAGYRLFGPFKLYDLKPGVSNEIRRAYNFARTVALTPPTWSIHPLTRDPAVLTRRGNLNKNLGNLILQCFTDDEINEMVESKILYAKPTVEPAYRNYMTWNEDDDISGPNSVFA